MMRNRCEVHFFGFVEISDNVLRPQMVSYLPLSCVGRFPSFFSRALIVKLTIKGVVDRLSLLCTLSAHNPRRNKAEWTQHNKLYSFAIRLLSIRKRGAEGPGRGAGKQGLRGHCKHCWHSWRILFIAERQGEARRGTEGNKRTTEPPDECEFHSICLSNFKIREKQQEFRLLEDTIETHSILFSHRCGIVSWNLEATTQYKAEKRAAIK